MNCPKPIIRDPDALSEFFPQAAFADRIAKVRAAIARGHHFAVTRYYLTNVIGDKADLNDPLLSVILPDIMDLDVEQGGGHIASVDEMRFTESPYLVQKYEGNAIMLVTDHCSQRCTHCFRKNVTDEMGVIPEHEVRKIFSDLSGNPKGDRIYEIIVSGGDPFTLPPAILRLIETCASQVNAIRHQRNSAPVRVSMNTREPVVAPDRILENPGLIEALSGLKPMSIGLHVLHPREITRDFCRVIEKLRSVASLLCTVHPILKGVNDDPDVLIDLYTRLAALGVLPHQLIHPLKSGIPAQKCVSLDRSMEIARELVKRLPGSLMPKLVCCTPSRGKSTVDPFHCKMDGTYGYDIRDGEIAGLRTKDGKLDQLADVF